VADEQIGEAEALLQIGKQVQDLSLNRDIECRCRLVADQELRLGRERPFNRFPSLVIAYSEGQIGWIPYVLERADVVWEENRGWGGVADKVKEPPSELFRKHVYGCFFNDAHGLRSLDDIGRDRVTYESDYPHSDSTWPNTRAIAEEQTKGLDDETIRMIMRDNAIRMLHLDR
jgi:predicted TIM-barrel fold metal-dependent hydrolase